MFVLGVQWGVQVESQYRCKDYFGLVFQLALQLGHQLDLGLALKLALKLAHRSVCVWV